MIDHLFLHCQLLWGCGTSYLDESEWIGFNLRVYVTRIISYMGLGKSIKGKTLWKIVCLTLIWIKW